GDGERIRQEFACLVSEDEPSRVAWVQARAFTRPLLCSIPGKRIPALFAHHRHAARLVFGLAITRRWANSRSRDRWHANHLTQESEEPGDEFCRQDDREPDQ